MVSAMNHALYAPRLRFSWPGLGGVALLHLAALALVANLGHTALKSEPQALIVDMIAALPSTPPIAPPRPAPPERKPVVRPEPAPRTPAPTLASRSPTPASSAETAAPRETPPAPAAPAALAPVAQPRFDADYLLNPAPAYPPLSRRLGEEGKVLLRVFVEAGGRPSQIEVKSSSGSPRLDQAAQEAVWRWKFVPARRGDEALGAWVQVPIIFSLKN